jgi:hypothetical protein
MKTALVILLCQVFKVLFLMQFPSDTSQEHGVYSHKLCSNEYFLLYLRTALDSRCRRGSVSVFSEMKRILCTNGS